ncbi:uncharacterized protein TRIVIDRAFT_50584 [Trichoderma virens Gv29-8]|uniref:F-box domain-containing protein n=1 Tax=Hypocrea virens (strain Gv29-8 / FGSC 10586) TaxID=413071 RepID=G9MXM6_HYPVG|nr:uncharacterized protein TRIVIDRAFT_50584 [Trichoderma virens Gv29-8]EHK20923.1 hypothetical protein TRIVIDRAFT_50584 [Trichoderma virens Gv29-8]UKZ56811.1 hypothetical protein TrVGV298_010652 [Trichoderma virens]
MDDSARETLNTPNCSASFELLAPELLLQIVTKLPGLDTLWNLMRASPQTWHLFDEYALIITESILSGPYSILPSLLPELMRGVILVRSGILPFRDLRDFQLRFMQSQFSPEILQGSQTSISPELLAASIVPVATLRSVVATAYHLSALAQACLESCLVRIRDPGFRPMHAYDLPAEYESIKPEDRLFVGTPVKVVDAGEPTWIEEMRALRAMWIIQLIGEVQCLVGDRAGTTGWSEEDVTTLSSMDAAGFVKRCTITRLEEVNTAMLYVRTLGDTIKNEHYQLPRAPSAAVCARRTITSPKPYEDAPAVYGFRRDNEIHILNRGSPVPKDGQPMISSIGKWGQSESSFFHPSPGVRAFKELTVGRARRISALEGVKFDSFRPLGLAFWDQWRMYLLGLTWGATTEWMANGEWYMPHFYHFAMESILPPEEVASVKAALREKRRQSIAQNSQ